MSQLMGESPDPEPESDPETVETLEEPGDDDEGVEEDTEES